MKLRKLPCFLTLLSVFIMNGNWILSNAFSIDEIQQLNLVHDASRSTIVKRKTCNMSYNVGFWGLWSSLAMLTWHRDCTVRAGCPRPRRHRSDPVWCTHSDTGTSSCLAPHSLGCTYRPGLMSYKTASKVASLCPQGWSPGCKTLASETEAGRCPEHVVGRKPAPIQAGARRGEDSPLDPRFPAWTMKCGNAWSLWTVERILGASKLKTAGQIPRNGNRSGLLRAAPGAKENGPLVPTRWTFISNLEWATQPNDDLNVTVE